MKPLSESEIESLLSRAPAPAAPSSLAARLTGDIHLSPVDDRRNGQTLAPPAPGRPNPEPERRRWWPLLLPGMAVAAFAATAVVQQSQLQDLQESIQQLEQRLPPATPALEGPTPGATREFAMPDERQDLERLRALALALLPEVEGGEAVRAEIDRLRVAIREAQRQVPAEFQPVLELQEKAERIRCVNNLKQLGLARHVYASDHNEEFPPDVLSMANEIGSPKLLVCPADSARTPAENWASYTPANVTYEFLAPGPGAHSFEPNRVMWRCPIHGTVTLSDGSVQQIPPEQQATRFVTHDGKLYLGNGSAVPLTPPPGLSTTTTTMDPNLAARYGLAVPTAPPGTGAASPAAGAQAPVQFQMSPELMRRYGLVPVTNAPPSEMEDADDAPAEPPQP